MYQGLYHGSRKHEPDLQDVLDRSFAHGMHKIVVTGGSLEDSQRAIQLARTNDSLYCTVGCHPTRCLEFDSNPEGPDAYLGEMEALITENREKVVAVGECGLDYDRLHFCDKETQKK